MYIYIYIYIYTRYSLALLELEFRILKMFNTCIMLLVLYWRFHTMWCSSEIYSIHLNEVLRSILDSPFPHIRKSVLRL